jgi:hypothetical protein
VPLNGSRFFALAFLRGFFVKLTPSELGKHARLFAGTFKTTQGCVEVFAFSYSDAWHLFSRSSNGKKAG